MNYILSGNALWSYQTEVAQRGFLESLAPQITGVRPFHKHAGEIALTRGILLINGDEDLEIPLSQIEQIYLGFDDVFPPSLTKNFGAFWQPLRISFAQGNDTETIYLIIDFNMISTQNQVWFEALKRMLS